MNGPREGREGGTQENDLIGSFINPRAHPPPPSDPNHPEPTDHDDNFENRTVREITVQVLYHVPPGGP